MLRKLPIGLIALSFLSASAYALNAPGNGSNPGPGFGSGPGSGTGNVSATGTKSGSGPGFGSGSVSRENEFNYFRIDCRFHGRDQDNDRGSDRSSDRGSDNLGGKSSDKLSDKFGEGGKFSGEKFSGNSFCYGSAVYRITDREIRDVRLAIGCDNRTIFNEDARVHIEQTLDRFQPLRAATPAIEVFPHGQLATEGTYTSVLDISLGRMKGLCYVHPVKFDDFGRKDGGKKY